MQLEVDAIFKENLAGGLKIYTLHLVNIYVSSCNSKSLHFDGFVLSKSYKVLDEKVQKIYVSWHRRVVQVKANSWEILIFWCDAIYLKKSVEGTLKVSVKPLTLFDEIHFIVNLYSLLLSLVHQAGPSLPKLSHLPPPKQKNFQNSPSLFLSTPLFWGYLNSQDKINKIVNSLNYHPCASRLASRIHYFMFL